MDKNLHCAMTPERLIMRKEHIMRWTLAIAYPAEILGAPKQNFNGIMLP